jgi:hypothetical protein
MSPRDLSPRRKRFIADLANAVFHDIGLGRVRVQPLEIIEEIEIGYSYDDFGDSFDGLIEHRWGDFHIYCNARTNEHDGSPRMRFTLAHELGHYFIDEHRNALAAGQDPHASKTDGPGKLLIEREANYFASNLLMPKTELVQFLSKTKEGLQSFLDIGSHFGVSAQSTAIRCVQDCGSRCAVVMFREGKSPWCELSPVLQFSGFTQPKRFSNGPPLGGAAAEAWAALPDGLSSIFTNTSTATTWFSSVTEQSDRNEIITEQAVRLGSRGVLTLLTFGAAPQQCRTGYDADAS